MRERGSSLLEVLLAAVVINVGILALAMLTNGLMRGNRTSERIGAAALAVQDQMEQLLAGQPLNAGGDLGLGPHPVDVSGAARYQGIDDAGTAVAASVPAGSRAYALLRRWVVSGESSTRCLRRVRVSVWNPEVSRELAAAESFINCP